MRICHVAPELLPVPPSRGGAIERWIRDAARSLADRGHDVSVISRDHGDGERTRALDGVKYQFVPLGPAFDDKRVAPFVRGLWYYARVGRMLARLRPEIVHHHSRPAGAWLSRRVSGETATFMSLHSMRYGWGFAYRACDRALFGDGFRLCERVLCVSEFIRRHTVSEYPDLASKATTLYNGVDSRLFRPRCGPTVDAPAPTILFVGRVEERKGVHLLLNAFKTIVDRLPGVRLRIVGPHSYWHAEPSAFYTNFLQRCGVTPGVEIHGPIYDDEALAETYRSATIGVVPSVFPEALGLTSLEAQASGLPVVVSTAGGLPETVQPGKTGVIFENGDATSLASSILTLLADPMRLREMGASARAWAVERFSWDRIASELESVYALQQGRRLA